MDGFHIVINLVGPLGQTRVIPVVTVGGADVRSHKFGEINMSMLMV